MFLPDPLEVPAELVEYLAAQLDIADPACVKSYTDRDKTKLEHAWEIQREYDLVPFAEVEAGLVAWIADQAWMTGDGPKAIFDGAVTWLRNRNSLLPQGLIQGGCLGGRGRAGDHDESAAPMTSRNGGGWVLDGLDFRRRAHSWPGCRRRQQDGQGRGQPRTEVPRHSGDH